MLYICPTPIGNLGDISLRCLEVLKKVDKIACEDKRVTVKLLKHYQISTPLIAYHQHNEQKISEQLLIELENGAEIALVSDAGMPLISDPGEILLQKVIDAGLDYTVLPGASAAITALVAAKMRHQPFYFGGFIKTESDVEAVKTLAATLIFYEAPHRLLKTLTLLENQLGNRKITICRELTKLYQEYYHGDIVSAKEHFSEQARGEFVLVIEPYVEQKVELSSEQIIELALQRLEQGERAKIIAKELAKTYGADRQMIYKKLVDRSHL